MLDAPFVNLFSHVKSGDVPWRTDGLRSFFAYRDLGVADISQVGDDAVGAIRLGYWLEELQERHQFLGSDGGQDA